MQNSQNTSIEHIIAKIDNDFNIDHSDWIPRVAAWVIEALSILKCTKTEYKTQKLLVKDKIGYSQCAIDFNHIKMYDENGCEVYSMKDAMSCGCSPSTGKFPQSNVSGRDEQIAIPKDGETHIGDYVTTSKRNVRRSAFTGRYYIPLGSNKFELNFEAKYVTIKFKTVKSYFSNTYNCELPVIPNNGLLIDAIGYYCMYKILCRGHKHPVMNLSASQYGTNPFFMWNHLKDEVKRSVMFDEQGDIIEDGGQWRNAFYNFTFNPRD